MQRIVLCFSSVCLLSIALLTASFTGYQRTIAQTLERGGCMNIAASPNYLRSRSPKDAIAAINHARQFENMRPLRLPGNFYRLGAQREQFVLINLERTDRGLQPLQMNAVLNTMARNYSRQMSKYHFFSHTSPISGTFTQRINSNPAIAHNYSLAEENLAGNPVAGVGPMYEYMYNDAQEACGHRRNILAPGVTLVGIGVVHDRTYGSLSTQEFIALQSGVSTLGA